MSANVWKDSLTNSFNAPFANNGFLYVGGHPNPSSVDPQLSRGITGYINFVCLL